MPLAAVPTDEGLLVVFARHQDIRRNGWTNSQHPLQHCVLTRRECVGRSTVVSQEAHESADDVPARVVQAHRLHVMTHVSGPHLERDDLAPTWLCNTLCHAHAAYLVRF